MFDRNLVREVVYGIGIIVALGSPPWNPITGWHWFRWFLAVLIIILLFMMLVR